ncbi:hypothetical protein [uncultured Tateyamaria sp.]|uniref:hypothetical protein n=1 Tax=uncultured Tateyamaria sp. TaxID=455651 RepID=UPI00262930C7|nr:hypothetical protein [uncultured Tateyamaria sp.]
MTKLSQVLTVVFLALALAIAPVRFGLKPNGTLTLEPPMALAKGGDDDDGEGGGGDDGGGDDGEGGGGDDGEGDDGDDGEGDDEDDDDGDDGEGDDGDDDGDDGEGDDKNDDGGDDDEGEEEQDDDETSSPSSNDRNASPDAGSYTPSGAISRIEVSGSGIEIRYANGAREEIKNGRYRVRDENGTRVIQRRATGPDVVRLRALAERVSIQSVVGRRQAGSAVDSVSGQGNSVTVTYGNGWTETLKRNSYTLKDPYGRTVVMRPATGQDKRRLSRIAQQNR